MLRIGPASNTPSVRRAVATLLIVVGLVVGAMTVGGWWLKRTAFVTSRTERLADSILENPVLRADLAQRISTEVSRQLKANPVQVRQVVDATLARPGVATTFAPVLGDIHARLIGLRTEPVVVQPSLLVAALGDPRAARLPPVSLTIAKVDELDTTRKLLDDWVGRGALIAVIAVLLGLALHPWRAAAVGMIGVGLLATAALLVAVGYLVPIRAVPALSDEPWLVVVRDVARDQQPVLIAVTVLLVGGALGCLFGAGLLARRNPQDSWRGMA